MTFDDLQVTNDKRLVDRDAAVCLELVARIIRQLHADFRDHEIGSRVLASFLAHHHAPMLVIRPRPRINRDGGPAAGTGPSQGSAT